MSENLRKYARALLLVVFIVSTLFLVVQAVSNMASDDAYDDAREIAWGGDKSKTEVVPATPSPIPEEEGTYYVAAPIEDAEEDEYLEELEEIDIYELQDVNPDVVGWIFIPDTNVDYPILQGQDNEYYLNHSWKHKKNFKGSIFMECENSPLFTDFNTILYGHNMNDGTMFADVSRYISKWYFNKHPHVYIVVPGFVLRYDVFASYRTPIDSQVYGLSYNQDVTREELIDYALEKSKFKTGIEPDVNDQILTLSTCTGGGYKYRWVMHARLKMVPAEVS